MAALALEFAILTAARSGEVLGGPMARRSTSTQKSGPFRAGRMKAAREHRVPLSEPTLAILTKLSDTKVSDYVFPGQHPGRPLSVMALEMVLRRMGIENATVHGFR